MSDNNEKKQLSAFNFLKLLIARQANGNMNHDDIPLEAMSILRKAHCIEGTFALGFEVTDVAKQLVELRFEDKNLQV